MDGCFRGFLGRAALTPTLSISWQVGGVLTLPSVAWPDGQTLHPSVHPSVHPSIDLSSTGGAVPLHLSLFSRAGRKGGR